MCEERAWLAGKEFRCVRPAGHGPVVFSVNGQKVVQPAHHFRKVEDDER